MKIYVIIVKSREEDFTEWESKIVFFSQYRDEAEKKFKDHVGGLLNEISDNMGFEGNVCYIIQRQGKYKVSALVDRLCTAPALLAKDVIIYLKELEVEAD